MLIDILNIIKTGNHYSLQEISEILNVEVDFLKVQMEYLEKRGYIKKTNINGSHKCSGCNACINKPSNIILWSCVHENHF